MDLLAWANWQRVQQVKKTPVPKPQPIRRPGAGTAAAKGAPTADALRDWRRRHGLEEVT